LYSVAEGKCQALQGRKGSPTVVVVVVQAGRRLEQIIHEFAVHDWVVLDVLVQRIAFSAAGVFRSQRTQARDTPRTAVGPRPLPRLERKYQLLLYWEPGSDIIIHIQEGFILHDEIIKSKKRAVRTAKLAARGINS
jgi:hypothetical protein